MTRRFNVTGLCIPEEDYMVDISGKIAQIKKLVDNRSYFTINRARQYGKTTTLTMLKRELNNEYIVAKISFEGLGDESFESEEAFCLVFLKLMQHALGFSSAKKYYAKKWFSSNVKTIPALSKHISKMCKGKKVVLMIDEIDKSSNNRVYIHFLGILRDKFLSRKDGMDFTFHSVILAGVYDIRNIKLKMIEEGVYTPTTAENKLFNSPWNIAVIFDIDMSFNPAEIATMLREYENDHRTGMDIQAVSNELYDYTSGYPFLVSRICQIIDEDMDREWTAKGVQKAVQALLIEKNTLFDDVFKNIENSKGLYDFVYNLLVSGNGKVFNVDNPIINVGLRYGFFRDKDGHIAIANRIFEIRMINYYISKEGLHNRKNLNGILQYDVVKDGVFDMELCLKKFAEHYAEIFNDSDIEFLERHGRLLFLSYLQPLINGQGFYHIESQFTDLRRMDIVVDFGKQQFIIELKIWRGQEYQAEAYEQLCGYLDSKGTGTGWLLTFDFRKGGNKIRKSSTKNFGAGKAEWIEVNGKKIFDVMV